MWVYVRKVLLRATCDDVSWRYSQFILGTHWDNYLTGYQKYRKCTIHYFVLPPLAFITVKVRFTKPRFTRSYVPKSYYQSGVYRTPVYIRFGLVHLPSHIPHSSFRSIPFLFRFASFRHPSVHYGHICPPPVSSILVYMSYATLPHTYGLLSPSHFPI